MCGVSVMNYKAFILVVFIIIGLSGLNSLGRFYMDDVLVRGRDFEGYFVVRNPSNEDFDDVNVRMYIYGLDVRLTSNRFDLNDGDSKLAYISWIVPERIDMGLYLARISVGNDKYRDDEYIYVRVV